MKPVWQSLRMSYIIYMFFIIFGMMAAIKASELSITQFLIQFLKGYGLLFIVLHALYILAFINIQGRVNRLHQQPPSSNDKQLAREKEQRAKYWLGRVGIAYVVSMVSLTGLAFYFAGHSVRAAFTLPVTFFLSFLILAGSGANIIIQNYLHFLRKSLAKTVDEVLAEKQAPVLYLRSFLDDKVAAKRDVTMLTEEEELNKAFEHIGPMIAIGKPGEALPEVGAARAYFTDDKWQAAVYHYMDISQLIVLRAGLSKGLLWEIQNSVQRLDPCKLIVLIPFEREGYDQFRTSIQSMFPKPLPDHPGHTVHRKFTDAQGQAEERKYGSLLGFIYFDDDWTAHFEKICADNVPFEYQMIGNQLVDKMNYLMVHYALRPIYARMGLTWDTLGLPWKGL